ncbi:hypothetical protein B0H14DRAFT_2984030, partial [Mycena olivaceomarginata]
MSWSSAICCSWGESPSSPPSSSSSESPKLLEGEDTLDLGGLGEGRAVDGILIDVTAAEWEEWIVVRSSSKLDSSSGRGELLAVDSVSARAGSSTEDKYGKSVPSPGSRVDMFRGCGIPCKLASLPSPVVLAFQHGGHRTGGNPTPCPGMGTQNNCRSSHERQS